MMNGRRHARSRYGHRMRLTATALALTLLSAACADRVTELGAALTPEPQAELAPAESCDGTHSDNSMVGCVIDAAGHTYEIGGVLPVLPAWPPYGMLLRFHGIKIVETDFNESEPSPNIRIEAYAAPYNIDGCPRFPEGDESNRVPARALTNRDGGIRVLVDDAYPSGTQVVINLGFHRDWLIAHQILPSLPSAAACKVPDGCAGSMDYQLGYGGRFYVGQEAPGALPDSPATPEEPGEPVNKPSAEGCAGGA
jgi:hypothetical protein